MWYQSIFANNSTNHSNHKKQRIVVDFDDTIAHDKGSEIGSPMPKVREALTSFKEAGYDVIIYSCRLTSRSDREREQEKERMTKWLNEHEIPFTEIDDGTHGKPISEYIIDNKALNYGGHEGDWEKIVRDILGDLTSSGNLYDDNRRLNMNFKMRNALVQYSFQKNEFWLKKYGYSWSRMVLKSFGWSRNLLGSFKK